MLFVFAVVPSVLDITVITPYGTQVILKVLQVFLINQMVVGSSRKLT